jgi:cytochrome c
MRRRERCATTHLVRRGAAFSVDPVDEHGLPHKIDLVRPERTEVRMRRSLNPLRLVACLFTASMIAIGGSPALAEGDVQAGANVFNRCSACHQIGPGARNAVGPHLNNLVGRAVASVPGFDYSDALAALGARTWSSALVADYIAAPARFIGARSTMPAQRLRPDQVADLLAYLESQ